jgi:hypothetical protein
MAKVSAALPAQVLVKRCVRRVRREYAKEAAWGQPLPVAWLHGYSTAILDLIWDLYSFDRVLKEQDWESVSDELSYDRLQTVGPEDYTNYFAEVRAFIKTIPPGQIRGLERPIRMLAKLLSAGEPNESKYQELIRRDPWILGAQYESVQDHRKLDDQNVPDFTAVRIRDKCRDILEIKSPFIRILRSDGELTSEFNEAWNQAERYLNFARENKDYLRRKKLLFENPRCYLIAGHQLTDDARQRVAIKQTMNPAIEMLTYDGLLAMANSAVKLIKDWQSKL